MLAKPPLPSITEHALFRYLERVKGIDMEHYRAEVAALVQPYVAIGARRVLIDGFSYEFDDNRLTTVQPAKRGKQQRRRSTEAP